VKIFIGSDHGGFKLKSRLKGYLKNSKDLGALRYKKTDDYPIYAVRVAKHVAKNKNSVGILICSSGQGVGIVANKIKGIRAAVVETIRDAKLAREDEDCNILCLSGRHTSLEKSKKIINVFLNTKPKTMKKYKRRINEITKLEEGNFNKTYKIVPTVIAKNQKEFDERFKRIKGFTNILQIDIMDGKFVKNKSDWFNIKLPSGKIYEAHLMINNPEEWVKKNYSKYDIIIANLERIKDPDSFIKFVKSKKKKVGFALNPETSLLKLLPYHNDIDRVLILTVHPGMYGAKFLPEVVTKIEMLRVFFDKDIEIDGSMNPKNIKLCKEAGANIFSVGSFIQDSKNIPQAIKKLKDILR